MEASNEPQQNFDTQQANPEVKDEGNKIRIKVKSSKDGEVTMFKVKKTTKFEKLMDIYCTRNGLNRNQVRFLFDGEKINPA